MRPAAPLLALLLCACGGGMVDQPRFEPFEETSFFPDGRSARPPVPGTVARGTPARRGLLLTGGEGGALSERLPFPVTARLLARGRERFDIYCSVCHGLAGYGDGPIVQRGFPGPPSFHGEELRRAPAGRYFQAMTEGFGVMPSYSDRVSPEDRWAIVAYIRALQLSQEARVRDLPPEDRRRLEALP